MVKVPTYDLRQVAPRPGFQQGVDVRATPSAFGADIGQGMQSVGQGLGQAADAFAQLRDLDDQLRSNGGDVKFADWLRNASYGEGGFMTLEGQAAVDARPAFEAQIEEKRKEFGAGLTGGAARAYDNATQSRKQSALQSVIVHAGNQRKAWYDQSTAALLDSNAEDAVAEYKNPKRVDEKIAAGLSVIRDQAKNHGWDAAIVENREKEYTSSVRMNTALRMMGDDPIAAEAYYKSHKDELTGPHQAQIEETLKVPVTNARALQHTNEFFSGSAGASYFDAIKSAESGGNPNAKNPTSSATGLYQFIDSTWRGLMARYPSLGLTADGRSDPAQQEVAIRAFTKENAGVLARSGINVTNGALYAAHFLGAGGAVNVLRADPAALVSDIVGAGVVSANSFLKGMTVADFAAWAERKGGGSGAPAAAAGGPMSYNMIEPFLASISDPTERETTRRAIYARLNGQEKAREEARKSYTENAYQMMVTQNISPFDMPAEVQAGVGMEGMSSLMSFWEKKSKGEPIKTDDMVLYDLQTAYATDPVAFSKEDMFKYRNSLSDTDWEKVNGWRQTALTDQTKAREEGTVFKKANDVAAEFYGSAGIKTGDSAAAKSGENIRLQAQFQQSMMLEVQQWQMNNQGKQPGYEDMRLMAAALTMNAIATEKRTSSFTQWFGEDGLDEVWSGKLFDRTNAPAGSDVTVTASFESIPVDWVAAISSALQQRGEEPTKDAIAAEWVKIVMETVGNN